jgi:hypothetical protein
MRPGVPSGVSGAFRLAAQLARADGRRRHVSSITRTRGLRAESVYLVPGGECRNLGK